MDEEVFNGNGDANQTQFAYQNVQNEEMEQNCQQEGSNSNNSKGKKTRKYRNKNSVPGAKVDIKVKLERSRQSARECRARKKLRYQYLEDLVVKRENANLVLKNEIEELKKKVLRSS